MFPPSGNASGGTVSSVAGFARSAAEQTGDLADDVAGQTGLLGDGAEIEVRALLTDHAGHGTDLVGGDVLLSQCGEVAELFGIEVVAGDLCDLAQLAGVELLRDGGGQVAERVQIGTTRELLCDAADDAVRAPSEHAFGYTAQMLGCQIPDAVEQSHVTPLH